MTGFENWQAYFATLLSHGYVAVGRLDDARILLDRHDARVARFGEARSRSMLLSTQGTFGTGRSMRYGTRQRSGASGDLGSKVFGGLDRCFLARCLAPLFLFRLVARDDFFVVGHKAAIVIRSLEGDVFLFTGPRRSINLVFSCFEPFRNCCVFDDHPFEALHEIIPDILDSLLQHLLLEPSVESGFKLQCFS